MRYTKAILIFSFLAVTSILFVGEQKVDEAAHSTQQQFIAIKNRKWCKEIVSFKDGANEMNGLISKPDYIKRSQDRSFNLAICSVMYCTQVGPSLNDHQHQMLLNN